MKISSTQAKEAALLLKDLIVEYYRDEKNMAAYVEWLHTKNTPDCIVELKRLNGLGIKGTESRTTKQLNEIRTAEEKGA